MIKVHRKEEPKTAPLFLKHVLWNSQKSIPTSLELSYSKEYLFVKMKAYEENALTRYTNDQDPVYQDSAMEFFIRFNEKTYFNFEFNRSGAVLAQYGPKEEREYLSKEWMRKLKRTVQITASFWSFELAIPWELFQAYQKDLMIDLFFFNAYKISEDPEHLHFQSLFKVESKEPDFHRPECFGKAILEKIEKSQ